MNEPPGIPTEPPTQRGISPKAIAAVAGAVLGGLVLAVVLLNLPKTETGQAVGSASPSDLTAPSASATPSGEASSSPTATAEPTPLPEAFTQEATFPGASANAMTVWPGGWIAMGRMEVGPSVWLSPDGVSWEATAPTGLDGGAVNHVVAIPDGRLLAFGFFDNGSLGGEAAAWISDDGRAWQRFDLGIPDLVNPVDVAAGPLGLVMIGRGETNEAMRNEYIWYSSNGLSWERVWESVEDEAPVAVGAGSDGFVTVGQQGYEHGDTAGLALASADGHQWIEASDADLVVAGPMWSIVPIGDDWMATSLGVEGPHVLRTENGLDWRFDTTFPGAEARRGGVAVLGGDDEFALLGSSLVPPAELPIMLFTERGGWEETGALGSGPIAAASRDGLTVLMVMLHSEIQFWVAATPE